MARARMSPALFSHSAIAVAVFAPLFRVRKYKYVKIDSHLFDKEAEDRGESDGWQKKLDGPQDSDN